MKEIISKILENNGFHSILEERFQKEKLVDRIANIYVNEYDEMYFLISGKIQKDTLNQILNICAEEEKSEFYKKAFKSNWILLYVAELDEKINATEKKYVMQIEENKFFCRKYVFWYTKKEKIALEELLEDDYSNEIFNRNIKDYELFSNFKEKGDAGYECLSRLFIKLPFLNLQNIQTTEDTIYTYVSNELKEINEKLAEIFETETIDEVLKFVDLNQTDLKNVNKKIEELGEEN